MPEQPPFQAGTPEMGPGMAPAMAGSMAGSAAQPQQIAMQRDEPEPGAARAALVAQWQERIKSAKGYWKKEFARMRTDMEFAKLGADGRWIESKRYTANVLQRHINQKVASLYAKNPKAYVARSERLDFSVWDGNAETLTAAQATFQVNPLDQTAQALIQDVFTGIQRRQMFDKIGKTLVILFNYFLREGRQHFKRQAKQGVRRALVTGIAYCEIGFQRQFEKRPEVEAEIADVTNKMSRLQSMSADLADGQLPEDHPQMEELRIMLRELMNAPEMIVREGAVFDWPGSTEIIIDPNTKQIDGWIGTGWLAREFYLSDQQIKDTYSVDVSKGAGTDSSTSDFSSSNMVNTQDGNTANRGDGSQKGEPGKHLVWKVWHKHTGHEFIVMDGWPDFLKEPDVPDVQIETFFPIFPLQFNPVEDDQEEKKKTRLYGLSEIELLRDMQKEYNRARQGLREHRAANRPRWGIMKGLLEDSDKSLLQSSSAHSVLELNLYQGAKLEDLMGRIPTAPIDPALYDVTPSFDDLMRTGGSQEANLGGTAGDTATEASIAEGSRVTFTQSNVDDLDDFLTLIARGTGQVLLLNMSREIVTQIAGPGAVWPEFTAQQAAEEVFLEIKAGSSGRPNRQLEIANMERITPFLLQLPGIRPQWLAEKLIERLDDDLDLQEAFTEGLPSIVALNSIKQAQVQAQQQGANGTANDPKAQGNQGGNNAPGPRGAEGSRVNEGPQAAFPSGQPGA